MSLDDRILGALYGQALGDAWGMPALLHPLQTWERFGGWLDRFYPAPPDHPVHAGLPAGRVTDDTEQAFAVAQAIQWEGKVTAGGVARALLAWYEQAGGERCPFIGPSTRRALQRLKAGCPVEQAGLGGDTNGAAMRASVVGLIHPADIEGAIRDAALQAIPTHHTDVAISGAAAVAAAVAVALVPDSSLESVLAAGIRGAEEGRRLGPPWMGASVARRIRMALEIAAQPLPPFERILLLYETIGSTLSATEAVPAAFGILAMANGDPIQTAVYAAALSGDADTVGAMACAIAGAWSGLSAFPPEILRVLREVNPELDFEGTAYGLLRLLHKHRV
ncbi:ADP-ribosylglycohydrolase family protein [Thermoflexus sp.]|uniref:ADP-ribosylglycohydrolase family protein n=1 Tax=Thermoflexus sp. TaxID=1969742 RepID=UPI001761DCA1|nr:ADP-ribosylglycohydrolase family protein [Thermoflexus sp.]